MSIASEQMDEALLGDAGKIANALLAVARSFMTMAERLPTAMCELQLSLANVASTATGPIYLGFVPPLSQMRLARSRSASQAGDLLFSELAFAQATFRARRGELLAELWKAARQDEDQTPSEWRLLQCLSALARE